MLDLGCKDCVNWEKFDVRGYGICRRHAPRPLVLEDVKYSEPGSEKYLAVSWPVTSSSDWCAEGKEPEYGPVNL